MTRSRLGGVFLAAASVRAIFGNGLEYIRHLAFRYTLGASNADQVGAMAKPLLTACIIARDEAKVISRCLSSIQEACDEFCLVDTGSVDGTAAIGKQFQAKVKVFTQCNDASGRIADFALARNACLAMATGKWILSIDADEVLQQRSVPFLRKQAQLDGADAVNVILRSGASSWPVVRLFKNAEQHRYHGRIHEWLSAEGEVITDSRIIIKNRPFKKGKESSIDRDLRLCGAEVKRVPDDTRMIFYFARALRRAGRYDEAIEHFKRYLVLEQNFIPGRYYAAHGIAVSYLLSKRLRAAIKAGQSALNHSSHPAETHCLLGDAYSALGNARKAIAAYQCALACGRPPADYPLFVDPSYYSTYPMTQLRRFELAIKASARVIDSQSSTYRIKVR
jgi:glycosyltransferase involved in cell wall biosynthesis